MKIWFFVLLIYPILMFNAVAKQSNDTQFLVIGKTANFRQKISGAQHMLNYHFFAEIFVKEGGHATNATLNNPSIDQMKFEDHAVVLETHGGRYNNETDLNDLYPNGIYTYQYEVSDGTILEIPVELSNNDDGNSRIPSAPIISLSQNGMTVSAANINPDIDLVISWTPFLEGGIDKNEIVDDLIFAFVANCKGQKISHSGVPFAQAPYLTFKDKKHTVKAEKLAAGQTYQVAVEHAIMDTNMVGKIPTIATYAATSFLDFNTAGVSENNCSILPVQMDKGQTDRSLTGTMELPKIDQQITMLYYNEEDFAKAVEFYSNDLKLNATFDDDWVKIYKLTNSAFIGVVKDSEGGFHHPNKDSAVMVSIVSKGVDVWYGVIKNAKNIKIEHEIYDSSTAPIRAFLIRDPGGYTIEFFQWNE